MWHVSNVLSVLHTLNIYRPISQPNVMSELLWHLEKISRLQMEKKGLPTDLYLHIFKMSVMLFDTYIKTNITIIDLCTKRKS